MRFKLSCKIHFIPIIKRSSLSDCLGCCFASERPPYVSRGRKGQNASSTKALSFGDGIESSRHTMMGWNFPRVWEEERVAVRTGAEPSIIPKVSGVIHLWNQRVLHRIRIICFICVNQIKTANEITPLIFIAFYSFPCSVVACDPDPPSLIHPLLKVRRPWWLTLYTGDTTYAICWAISRIHFPRITVLGRRASTKAIKGLEMRIINQLEINSLS